MFSAVHELHSNRVAASSVGGQRVGPHGLSAWTCSTGDWAQHPFNLVSLAHLRGVIQRDLWAQPKGSQRQEDTHLVFDSGNPIARWSQRDRVPADSIRLKPSLCQIHSDGWPSADDNNGSVHATGVEPVNLPYQRRVPNSRQAEADPIGWIRRQMVATMTWIAEGPVQIGQDRSCAEFEPVRISKCPMRGFRRQLHIESGQDILLDASCLLRKEDHAVEAAGSRNFLRLFEHGKFMPILPLTIAVRIWQAQ